MLKEVQLQENGERFKIFVMVYCGLVLVFQVFIKSVTPCKAAKAETRAIAKIIMCPPLHKKITFTKKNYGFTPV